MDFTDPRKSLSRERNQIASSQLLVMEEQNRILKATADRAYEQQERALKDEKLRRLEDKVDDLRLTLVQCSDSVQKAQVEILLDEAIERCESYREQLKQEEAYQLYLKRQAEKKRLVMGFIGLFVFLLLMFFAFVYFFSSSDNQRPKQDAFASKQLLIVPDLVETDLAFATNTLKRMGLKVGNVRFVAHDTILENGIISTNPVSQTKIAKGSTIDLTVSKGREGEDTPFAKQAFQITIKQEGLIIRSSPGLRASIVETIPLGTYTIVDTQNKDDRVWGKLKSGKGWLDLSFQDDGKSSKGKPEAPTVDTKNLTTAQVKQWIVHTFLNSSGYFYDYTAKDTVVKTFKADDGLVYSRLYVPSDPDFETIVYRINEEGVLEELIDEYSSQYWEIVSEHYME